MIPLHDFIPLVQAAIPRFALNAPNAEQQQCILQDPTVPLMIVAGPGSGKTTVLVLRALRLVFVDQMLPEQIVLTTFTKKAATELRSRLIEWGLNITTYLRSHPPTPSPNGFFHWLPSIDINRFVTGTLDSICEDVFANYRSPADPAPVLVEGFVGNGILVRDALFPNNVHTDEHLNAYLSLFAHDSPPRNFGDKVQLCRTLLDRFIHDLVDLAAYSDATEHQLARRRLADCAHSYRQVMAQNHRMDFALLEDSFVQRLEQGGLHHFTSGIRAVLVDEYQDTNPLQERIYTTILDHTGASYTIVGDDDQSLYRFRGATVELFRDFETRLTQLVPSTPSPQVRHLFQNYRSTPAVVQFINSFIATDPDFQTARVQPPKPPILPRCPSNGVPVLGMFRDDAATLADDLATFLRDVFRDGGRSLHPHGQSPITIARATHGGDFGDAVVLSHTVNEFAAQFGATPPRERLPRLLRARLAQLEPPVSVFNPRGRHLRDILPVRRLLGAILNCIDPGRDLENNVPLRAQAARYFSVWRQDAANFALADPPPATPHTLAAFIHAWQHRTPQGPTASWPPEWPLLELCFKLMTWIPELQDDPEGQVYLEAVSRAIAQAATFSPYRSTIVHGRPPHDDNSVKAIMRDILAPIAESAVEVDEEIMAHVPRDRLPIMTIHQAKGLEYPLVIVDVSSDYRTNNAKSRFRRFPERPTSVQVVEDELAPFCEVGPLRQTRTALRRTFDDLVRLYYVAYSRPESVLMLVGLTPCMRYSATIRHVATGWRSDGIWSWRDPVDGPLPGLVNGHPLELI